MEPSVNSVMLKGALTYVEKFGFSVFPLHSIENSRCSCGDVTCDRQGKHPRTKNGLYDATKETRQIISWWTKWPNANIGIACGIKSGIFVLDVDINEEVNGYDTLYKLQGKYGSLPKTAIQISGSGGAHYFFNYSEGMRNKTKFLPGLDIKTDGGYIIGAPSNHFSGGTYMWRENYHIGNTPMVDAPEWLLKLAIQENDNGNESGYKKRPTTHWTNLLNGLSKGSRNNAATSLTGYLLYKSVDYEVVYEILKMWNERNNPPLSTRELEKTIKSISRKEQKRRSENRGERIG